MLNIERNLYADFSFLITFVELRILRINICRLFIISDAIAFVGESRRYHEEIRERKFQASIR